MEARESIGRALAAAALAALAGCAEGPTLVASDPASGFEIYRSGQLSEAELAALCARGVEEIVVLAGSAADRECRLRGRACPEGLRVRYDVAQDADRPLARSFLDAFDRWVAESRAAGRKIAFRCRHGWHRAGRLAAWVRMRHQGWGAAEAEAEMLDIGRFMWRHRQLVPQVAALADEAAGRECTTAAEHCVAPRPNLPGEPDLKAGFAADVCP